MENGYEISKEIIDALNAKGASLGSASQLIILDVLEKHFNEAPGKSKFHPKNSFAVTPAPAKTIHNLENCQEIRIVTLENKWVLTYRKVDPPTKEEEWEANDAPVKIVVNAKAVAADVEELLWLKKYSDPQTNTAALHEEGRIAQLENQLISALGITFERFSECKQLKDYQKEQAAP